MCNNPFLKKFEGTKRQTNDLSSDKACLQNYGLWMCVYAVCLCVCLCKLSSMKSSSF